MKKKILLIPLALLLAVVLVTSCASPAPTVTAPAGTSTVTAPAGTTTVTAPAGTTTVTATATPAAPAEVINIKVSTTRAAGNYFDVVDGTGKVLEDISGGHLKFTLLPGDVAAPVNEHLEANRDGVFDLSLYSEGYFQEREPVMRLFTCITGTLRTFSDVWILYDRMGYRELGEEVYGRWNQIPVGITTYKGSGIISKVPIPHFEDLDGIKLRSGPAGTPAFKEAGVDVISFPPDELYSALASGLVDAGESGSATSQYASGFHEVTKYWILPETQQTGRMAFVANLDFWNSISEMDRAQIEAAWYVYSRQQSLDLEYDDMKIRALVERDYGIIVQQWDAGDWAQWAQANVAVSPTYPDNADWVKGYDILGAYMAEMGYGPLPTP